MGLHAQGDVQNIIYNSEDEEGYEHFDYFLTRTIGSLNRLNIQDQKCFTDRTAGRIKCFNGLDKQQFAFKVPSLRATNIG